MWRLRDSLSSSKTQTVQVGGFTDASPLQVVVVNIIAGLGIHTAFPFEGDRLNYRCSQGGFPFPSDLLVVNLVKVLSVVNVIT